MLKLKIDKHCRLRNQQNTPAYLRKQGFSYWVSYQLINTKKDNIRFSDLERLCILFRCTPNDLLEWDPDSASLENSETHPLAPLKKEKNIADDMSNFYFAQLKEAAKIIKGKK